MKVPVVSDVTVTQAHVTYYIDAFQDYFSGSTSPPSCGPRTCSTSGSQNVIWDNTNQRFEVKTLGSSDVAGQYSVQLGCTLQNYSIQGSGIGFQLTIPAYCNSGNAMIAPTLPDITSNPNQIQYIDAFQDQVSGATNPPTCGNRTCISNNTYVEWNSVLQKFQIGWSISWIPGVYTIRLDCRLQDHSNSTYVLSLFNLTVAQSCSTGNKMIVPLLTNVEITQAYTTTFLDAFKDFISGLTSPPACGPRTCSTSGSPNVSWDATNQKFRIQTNGVLDVAGNSVVTLTCSLTNHAQVAAVSTQFNVIIPVQCGLGNNMIVPAVQDQTITSNYAVTYVKAFFDHISGVTSSPTCGPRTCSTTGSQNVIWEYINQRFTIKSLGAEDVVGTYQVFLTCQLENYPSVPSSTAKFNLIIMVNCELNNSIKAPILPDITITQDYKQTTIPAFDDLVSGLTIPPMCGPRNCTSNNDNVVWDASNQTFIAQSLGQSNQPGNYKVTLTCFLASYSSVQAKSAFFNLRIITSKCQDSYFIINDLQDIYMDQYTKSMTIEAFQDSISQNSKPPSCGVRSCSSNNANVIWDQISQIWNVKYFSQQEKFGTFLVNLKCSLVDHPSVKIGSGEFYLTLGKFQCPKEQQIGAKLYVVSILSLPDLQRNQKYVIKSNHNFLVNLNQKILTVLSKQPEDVGKHTIKLNLEDGEKSCSFDVNVNIKIDSQKNCNYEKNISSQQCKAPLMKVSNINSRGKFRIDFSEPVNIQQLSNPNVTIQTEKIQKLFSLELLQTSSVNQDLLGFNYDVTHVNSTQIEIQLKFQNPQQISIEKGNPDKLLLQLLPQSFDYFYSLSQRVQIKNPLQKFQLPLPTQLQQTRAATIVERISSIVGNASKITIAMYVVLQIFLSLSLEKLWTIQNALNIILSFQLINISQPANVNLVFTYIVSVAQFNVIPAGDIISKMLPQSETKQPGTGFVQSGVSSLRLIPYLGLKWLMLIPGLALYISLGVLCLLENHSEFYKKAKIWLHNQLIYSAVIKFCVQTYFDFCCGCLLSILDPKFLLYGDYVDMAFTYIGIAFVICFPIFVYFFLGKYQKDMGDKAFIQRYGSLYSGYSTNSLDACRNTKLTVTIFLLRRLLVSISLVLLENSTVWIQITFLIYLQLVEQCLKIHWFAFADANEQRIEQFNDFLVLLMSQMTFLFTDLILDASHRYLYGWIYCGVAGLLAFVNIAIMAKITLVKVFQIVKKWTCHAIQKHQLKIAKQNAQNAQKIKDEVSQNGATQKVIDQDVYIYANEIVMADVRKQHDEAQQKEMINKYGMSYDENIYMSDFIPKRSNISARNTDSPRTKHLQHTDRHEIPQNFQVNQVVSQVIQQNYHTVNNRTPVISYNEIRQEIELEVRKTIYGLEHNQELLQNCLLNIKDIAAGVSNDFMNLSKQQREQEILWFVRQFKSEPLNGKIQSRQNFNFGRLDHKV